MSKKGYFQRYFTIIASIKKKKFISFEELETAVQKIAFSGFDASDTNIGFSKRTFQRDLKEIDALFSIEIKFDRKQKGYYIDEGIESTGSSQRILEVFDIFHTVQMTQNFDEVIFLEPRKPQATYLINDILEAIKKRQAINIQYQKFNDTHPTLRTIECYGLKEYKNRWYLLGVEEYSKKLKSFALDRIATLQKNVTKKYDKNTNINIDEIYNNCFGIITPNQEKVQHVVVTFDKFQKDYIKTLPLHHTQKILNEDPNNLTISLDVYITPDFITELLSFGQHVKVIKPASLVQKIKSELLNTLKIYD